MKVVILKGLPASGKSTYAKELVAKGNWVRVNKDDLRAMCHNGKWSKPNEKLVLAIRDLIIVEALAAGQNVVVDDTNFEPKHEAQIRELAASFNPEFEVKFFDTPVDECIKRDIQRPNSVGKDVIIGMYNKYLKPQPEVYAPPADKPLAIMCDIDGTLAHHNDRSPYDMSRVGEDGVDEVVRGVLYHYHDSGHKIILMSGRDSSCRQATEDWLLHWGVPYDELHMRPAGDKRKDFTVKRELFDQNVRNNYRIEFVLDDRTQVIEEWRRMGLKAFQVAPGDF